MKFEIEFDEDIYNKQMDLLFDLTWKRKISYFKNSQYLGIILILIGIAMIYNWPNIFGLGYVFFFFGLSNLIPFLYYYFKIKSSFKKFDIAKSKDLELSKSLKNFVFELTDKSLIISSEKQLKVIDWDGFLMSLLREDNLILITKDYNPYILSELEVGKENFEKIVSFVKQKIESK